MSVHVFWPSQEGIPHRCWTGMEIPAPHVVSTNTLVRVSLHQWAGVKVLTLGFC